MNRHRTSSDTATSTQHSFAHGATKCCSTPAASATRWTCRWRAMRYWKVNWATHVGQYPPRSCAFPMTSNGQSPMPWRWICPSLRRTPKNCGQPSTGVGKPSARKAGARPGFDSRFSFSVQRPIIRARRCIGSLASSRYRCPVYSRSVLASSATDSTRSGPAGWPARHRRSLSMPQLVSNMVDAYIFRRVNARLQFLLLLRRPDLPLGNTWQSIHAKILLGETAIDAARRAMEKETGMTALEAYSADYINQFYDHHTDSIILAPVFAFAVPQRPSIILGEELCDSAWCERDEATARLLWPGQRWAVRHIDAILGLASEDAEFFRIDG